MASMADSFPTEGQVTLGDIRDFFYVALAFAKIGMRLPVGSAFSPSFREALLPLLLPESFRPRKDAMATGLLFCNHVVLGRTVPKEFMNKARLFFAASSSVSTFVVLN